MIGVMNWPADHRDLLSSAVSQNGRLRALDLLQRGEITAAQANVMMVRAEGVRLVSNRLPRAVRQALDAAVRAGELGHLKKEGRQPEVYFLPQAKSKALTIRWREEQALLTCSRSARVSQRELDRYQGVACVERAP